MGSLATVPPGDANLITPTFPAKIPPIVKKPSNRTPASITGVNRNGPSSNSRSTRRASATSSASSARHWPRISSARSPTRPWRSPAHTKTCEDCHAPLDALAGSPQQQPTDSTRSLRLISTIEWGANPMETTGSQEKLPLLPMQDRADLVAVDLSIDGQAICPGAREGELRCRFGVIDVL